MMKCVTCKRTYPKCIYLFKITNEINNAYTRTKSEICWHQNDGRSALLFVNFKYILHIALFSLVTFNK